MFLFRKKGGLVVESIENQYNFLYDEPLSSGDKQENIDFGHQYIAESIIDVLKSIKPPFTIGLFGRFGIGKSTIINKIKELIDQDKKIKIVIFDAWKYERDSLRRQFLINLDEELRLGKKYKESLYQSMSEPNKINTKFTIRVFIFGILILLLMALIISGIFIGVSFFDFSQISFFKRIPENLIIKIFDFSVMGILLSGIFSFFQVNFSTKQISKTDSAEGFEDRFYNEVLKSKKLKKIEKICIVIDNLDRVSYKKAIDLLSDIKTFLSCGREKLNKTIFLIACDEVAIKNHLEKCNYDDPEEFIRKFFNASFSIPPNLYVELGGYVKKQLELTNFKLFTNNEELKSLIIRNFRNTPREIKQFINTLLIYCIIAKKMEDNGQIAIKITQDLVGLTKVLIIKQKFPILYKIIEQRTLTESISWKEVRLKYEEMYNSLSKRGGEYEISKIQKNKIEQERLAFNLFSYQERHIDIRQLQAFIRLKQSSEELIVPEINNLKTAIQNNDSKMFGEIIKKVSPDNLLNIDALIKNYVEESSNKGSFDVPYFTLAVIKDLQKDTIRFFKETLESSILNIDETRLDKKIEVIPPKDVFIATYEVLSDNHLNLLIKSYLSVLKKISPPSSLPVQKEYIEQILFLAKNYSKHFNNYNRHINDFLNYYMLGKNIDIIQAARSVGSKITISGFSNIDINERVKINQKSEISFEINLVNSDHKFSIYFYVKTDTDDSYWIGYRNGEPGEVNSEDENTILINTNNSNKIKFKEKIFNAIKRLPNHRGNPILLEKVRLRADDQNLSPVVFDYKIK